MPRFRAVEKVVLEERDGVVGKSCTRCDTWKPLDDSYNRHKTCVGNRDSVCKECRKRYREKTAGYIKKYNEFYRTANKDRILQKDKEYRENNREKILAKFHVARAKELGVDYEIDWSIVSDILAEFKGECPLTGSTEIHLDHFIPISKGGTTTRRNLIPLKGSLNRSKRNSNPFSWAEKTLKGIELVAFNDVVEYLAELNDMSLIEYKAYVNSHFEEVSD
jgi:5-methylcytosine-specific restriction endonuclease McrA